MTLTITLPWPHVDLSPNGRANRFAHARAKKAAKNYAWGMTKALMGPLNIRLGSWVGDVQVQISLHPVRNYPDDDNAIATQKAALDGIASALGIDDKHFRQLPPIRGEKRNPGAVVITLTPEAVAVPVIGTINGRE